MLRHVFIQMISLHVYGELGSGFTCSMKDKLDKIVCKEGKKSRTHSPKLRTHSPRPRTSDKKSHFSVSPTVKEFQEMKIKCEDDVKTEAEGKVKVEMKEETEVKVEIKDEKEVKVEIKEEVERVDDRKGAGDAPVVVPIRKGRKGSKWQASGFITKQGDQILSYTAENGVTYRRGGKYWYIVWYTIHWLGKFYTVYQEFFVWV